jgi:TonB family protein
VDVVSQVLSVRARELGGLERMMGASVVAHIGFVAALALAPGSWLAAPIKTEQPAMVIDLGGAEGPVTGRAQLSARPIQTEQLEARKTIEAVRPPAARAPEMTEPRASAPKKSETKVDTTTKDARSKTPTKGAEIRSGTAVAETNSRGQGFGLSGGGFGSGSRLNVANFCCPEYLGTMQDLIKRNWDSRQQAVGTVGVKFTVQRDGQLTDISVDRPSGYPALDYMATRALFITKQLPPLPQAFTEPSLTVFLVFEYRR